MLAALQAGSRGTQACINAASTVSGIIGDLDTTIMFATAGTLHAENENESFADHRENILKTAKALVEDTKTLVAGTEQLHQYFNPLNPKLNPICYLLALLAHHFLHVSRIRVKSLTIRLLMSYVYMCIYIYIYIYIWSTYS